MRTLRGSMRGFRSDRSSQRPPSWKALWAHHALLVEEMLARIDQLDESIERLSVEVARVLVPFSPLVALLFTRGVRKLGCGW